VDIVERMTSIVYTFVLYHFTVVQIQFYTVNFLTTWFIRYFETVILDKL